MDQKIYWNNKHSAISKTQKPNPFAKRMLISIGANNFKKILDLGCGDGRDAIFFAKNGLRVVAVDFSNTVIKKLEKRAAGKNIKNMVFNQIYRILRKGGMLFMKVKSTEDALYGKGKAIEKDMFIYEHLRHFFSKSYTENKLKRFETVKIRKTSGTYHTYKSSFIEAIACK